MAAPSITDITPVPFQQSNFVKPFSIEYSQNGKKRRWDCIKEHQSVAILLFNVSRQALVLVKQFRPAVYISSVEDYSPNQAIDIEKYPISLGMTYELCAGIIDKNKPPIEIAQSEILEECGYNVPLESIEKITTYRSSVGISGALQILYYAEVEDSQRVSDGGGLAEEGEAIEVVEIPVERGKEILLGPGADVSTPKPAGLLYTILWFYQNKFNQI